MEKKDKIPIEERYLKKSKLLSNKLYTEEEVLDIIDKLFHMFDSVNRVEAKIAFIERFKKV